MSVFFIKKTVLCPIFYKQLKIRETERQKDREKTNDCLSPDRQKKDQNLDRTETIQDWLRHTDYKLEISKEKVLLFRDFCIVNTK